MSIKRVGQATAPTLSWFQSWLPLADTPISPLQVVPQPQLHRLSDYTVGIRRRKAQA
jgi:hypothetical protein